MADALSIASDGHITSSGTGDSLSIASGGFIVTVTSTQMSAELARATALPSYYQEYEHDKEDLKKITLHVTFPDGVKYETSFVVPPIDIKIGEVSIDEKERKISFSITPPKTSAIKKQNKVTLLLEEEVTKK